MIREFNYIPLQKVLYGENAVSKINSLLSSMNISKVLVMTSPSVTKTSAFNGLLNSMGVDFSLFGQVTQHSPLAEIEHATEQLRNHACDGIISVGGGSVIDSAKVVRYYHNIDLPQIAIPTTLSAAEFSHIAGYSIGGEKNGIRDKKITPGTVILDPDMTLETPDRLWRSTGIRSLDHAIESLIHQNLLPLSRDAALKAIKMLSSNLHEHDVASRLECQIAAWYSYWQVYDSPMGISHTLGRILGARYDIPHGITSCITLPTVLKHYSEFYPSEMSEIASAISGKPVRDEDPANASFLVGNLIDSLGLRETLNKYSVGMDQLDRIIASLNNPEDWHKELVKELIEAR